MALPEKVREEARRILGEADLDNTNGRTIKTLIGESLDLSKEQLKEFKFLIEEEIATFLEQRSHGPLPATPAALDLNSQEDSKDSENRPSKQRRIESDEENKFALSDTRRIVVRTFKGKVLIDVREFYEKDGEQKPGSKGLALTQEQWQLLATSIPSLSEAAEENNIEYFVELGNKRRASVTSYKGGNNVDLREFYDKDGNMAPGKKGIALTLDQWQRLCSISEQVTNAAGPLPQAEPKAESSTPTQPKEATQASGGDAEFVDLGNLRRASVSEFKGKKLLNIREYYEKDGEMRPGKKGISLTRDQAESLSEGAQGLSEALSQQRDLSVLLGNKRHAKVNKYKSACLLDIREYYEKDGEEKPGYKGISLTAEQWKKLAGNLTDLVSGL